MADMFLYLGEFELSSESGVNSLLSIGFTRSVMPPRLRFSAENVAASTGVAFAPLSGNLPTR